jgi:hypothetical protein
VMVYYLMCVPFSFPRLDPTFFFLSFFLAGGGGGGDERALASSARYLCVCLIYVYGGEICSARLGPARQKTLGKSDAPLTTISRVFSGQTHITYPPLARQPQKKKFKRRKIRNLEIDPLPE